MEERGSEAVKKIGMLTFHQCHNYGAMLCAFALQQAVFSLGCEAEYIDLENEIFEEHGKKAGHQLYRRQDEESRKYVEKYRKDLERRWSLFESFKHNYIKCSTEVKDLNEIKRMLRGYDILLVGGDQLWNEDLPVALEAFVLPFMTDAKRVSYGTSMGGAQCMSLRRRMYLKKFSAIGVRETYAAEYIKKYAGVPAVVTIDPVFLLKKRDWEQISVYPDNEHYILAYIFNNDSAEFEKWIWQLQWIAEKCHQRVVVCASDAFEETEGLETRIAVGPREWLGLIFNADFVITNSFHGVAFSIIYEKKFVCLDTDRRKKELLSYCGVLDRASFDLNEYMRIKDIDIDYISINKGLLEKIKWSYDFLKQELR